MSPKLWWLHLVLVALLGQAIARKHHLEIRVGKFIRFFKNFLISAPSPAFQNDYRRYIALSTFGFYRDGILDVNFHNFQLTKPETTMVSGMGILVKSHRNRVGLSLSVNI